MFQKATKMKLRFNYKGQVSVEDLWDLSVKSLDEIYKQLKTEEKESKGESLLEEKSSRDDILSLKIEIVTYIVKTKLEEMAARKSLEEKAAQKQKILGIIAEKQDESLKGLSLEELKNLVNEL